MSTRRTPAERNAIYCPICKHHGNHQPEQHDETREDKG